MKAREYIEHCFFPWILFLDYRTTWSEITQNKENYFLELYNHISRGFRSLDFYELYMFRLQCNRSLLPIGMSDVAIVRTPAVKNPLDAAYLIIIRCEETLLYYTVDYSMDVTYQIRKFVGNQQTIIGTVKDDINEIMQVITADLVHRN